MSEDEWNKIVQSNLHAYETEQRNRKNQVKD
eukprot:CAMPEP_0116879996 /NCGR_PEP_ID=MMETSP0463-20121206/11850_1 /TAXON_ID=181622 /ORGANISM="Strombidinopsis sp, Strain SopsisLIS2011" /LENGTH=30 /DNA_ID= /DNA_START= /DNA_END= /DNA_ORIENTATION=